MKKRSREGFTLGELLVVVAIISVLTTIALPTYFTRYEEAKETQDKGDMRDAYALFEAYCLANSEIDGKKARTYTKYNPAYYDGDDITSSYPTYYGSGTTRDGGTASYYACCTGHTYVNTTDYTNSVIICYYDEGTVHVKFSNMGEGTSDGGGSKTDPTPTTEPTVTPTPDSGNTGGDKSEGETGTVIIGGKEFVWHSLPTLDELIKDSSFTITKGKVYKYNGVIYVCNNTQLLGNQWYQNYPSDNTYWLYMQPNNDKVYTSSDINSEGQLLDLKVGDLYVDDNGDVYIRNNESTHGGPPSTQKEFWVLITN